jgi:hypothetical protein
LRRELQVEHAPPSPEHLLQLALRPHRAERTGARTDHGDGLAADRRLGDGAGDPVERVLERTRDRPVVLGRREEDRVRLGDRGLERVDRVRSEIIEILVVCRDLGEALEDVELDARRQLLRGEAEELRVTSRRGGAAIPGWSLYDSLRPDERGSP